MRTCVLVRRLGGGFTRKIFTFRLVQGRDEF